MADWQVNDSGSGAHLGLALRCRDDERLRCTPYKAREMTKELHVFTAHRIEAFQSSLRSVDGIRHRIQVRRKTYPMNIRRVYHIFV